MAAWEERGFDGTVIAMQGDEVVFHEAFGEAIRGQVANSTDTVFDVGSITKQFTAAAILALEAEGLLAVEDTLGDHFAGVPADKTEVTLHELLTHSAGFPAYLGGDYEVLDRASFVEQALASDLAFPPGEGYLYSNVSYSLLAAIVEQTTVQSWEEALAERFFTPLGMTRTGYVLPQWSETQVANGYGEAGDFGSPLDHPWAADGPWWNLRGNGGVLSTSGDMAQWTRALVDGEVLELADVARMHTPWVLEEDGESWYGYGWVIADGSSLGRRVVHSGGNGHFYAVLRYYPENDLITFSASNDDQGEEHSIAEQVAHLVVGF